MAVLWSEGTTGHINSHDFMPPFMYGIQITSARVVYDFTKTKHKVVYLRFIENKSNL
jgi:hypothetical protein